jgi:hypothetical protein
MRISKKNARILLGGAQPLRFAASSLSRCRCAILQMCRSLKSWPLSSDRTTSGSAPARTRSRSFFLGYGFPSAISIKFIYVKETGFHVTQSGPREILSYSAIRIENHRKYALVGALDDHIRLLFHYVDGGVETSALGGPVRWSR